jgi:hypothetical protein
MCGDRECVIILQGMEESDEHFANDPVRERESIIQQTFWITDAALSTRPYVKEDYVSLPGHSYFGFSEI